MLSGPAVVFVPSLHNQVGFVEGQGCIDRPEKGNQRTYTWLGCDEGKET